MKTVKFEGFCGNIHRYNDRHKNTIRKQWKKGLEIFSDKTENFHLTCMLKLRIT